MYVQSKAAGRQCKGEQGKRLSCLAFKSSRVCPTPPPQASCLGTELILPPLLSTQPPCPSRALPCPRLSFRPFSLCSWRDPLPGTPSLNLSAYINPAVFLWLIQVSLPIESPQSSPSSVRLCLPGLCLRQSFTDVYY